MSEVITTPERGQSVDSQPTPPAGEGIRRGFRAAFETIDLSVGVAMTSAERKVHAGAMDTLDAEYDGLLSRRTAADRLSMALQQDVQLTFRAAVQRAGFTKLDQVPASTRAELADQAAAHHIDEIMAELTVAHSDWDESEVADLAYQYAQDIATVLAMGDEDRDAYRQAMFDYQEHRKALNDLEAQNEDLRAARSDIIKNLGRISLDSLVAMAHKVGQAPYAIAAHATVAVAQVRGWYTDRSPEGKRAVLASAAGVAIAGLVSYISFRHTGGGSQGGGWQLTSMDSLSPHNGPTGLGAPRPIDLGNAGRPGGFGNVLPTHLGNSGQPAGLGNPNSHPGLLGGSQPSGLGNPPQHPGNLGNIHRPSGLGNGRPDNLGSGRPGSLGNPNTVTMHTSHELFTGTETIDSWPDTITVSRWDSHTHDGSLWGISEQLLRRSGVSDPDGDQVQKLVDALRPQAQPNGFLLRGQKLHLKPAFELLHNL